MALGRGGLHVQGGGLGGERSIEVTLGGGGCTRREEGWEEGVGMAEGGMRQAPSPRRASWYHLFQEPRLSID